MTVSKSFLSFITKLFPEYFFDCDSCSSSINWSLQVATAEWKTLQHTDLMLCLSISRWTSPATRQTTLCSSLWWRLQTRRPNTWGPTWRPPCSSLWRWVVEHQWHQASLHCSPYLAQNVKFQHLLISCLLSCVRTPTWTTCRGSWRWRSSSPYPRRQQPC